MLAANGLQKQKNRSAEQKNAKKCADAGAVINSLGEAEFQ